jgi:metal-sulfur cluster biosynthetic enzyme
LNPPDAATVRDALRAVADPEAGIDIVELGLVYDITISAGHIRIDLATTSPACPTASLMADEARAAVLAVAPGCTVDVVRAWDPPWSPERMSAKAKQELGWD